MTGRTTLRCGVCAATVVAVASIPAAFAQPKDPDRDIRPKPVEPMPQRVEFTTADGVKIVGTYYAALVKSGPRAPAAILVHMYPADRNSWRPLAPRLSLAGFAVLAYDIRGTGDSSADPALARGYRGRDPELFQAAWKDADAAVKWLATQPDVDTSRIAMIGASIGCSISLEYCSRNENVRAAVCLSPGLTYFNVNSVEHIRACGDRPILLIAPEAEREAPETLAKIGRNVTVDIRPGTREQHGTYMFEQAYGVKLMNRIVDFVHAAVRAEPASSRPAARDASGAER